MTKQNNTVAKMLTPEEEMTIDNLIVELQALKQSAGAPTEEMAPQVEKQENMGNGEEDLEKTITAAVKAALGKTPETPVEKMLSDVKENPQGPTARDKGEDRLDPTTSTNQETISEVMVKKALLEILKSQQTPTIQAAQPAAQVNLEAVIKSAMTPVINQLKQQEDFNNAILKSLGVADEIESSVNHAPVQNVVKSQGPPVANLDANVIAEAIMGRIQGKSQLVEKSGEALIEQFDPLKGYETQLIRNNQNARKTLRESLYNAVK